MSTTAFLSLSSARLTVRSLWRHPAFTVASVITLALGVGATTALFSVVYGVLIKPLPYPDAEKLVSLRHSAPGLAPQDMGVAESMYVTYREENSSFEQIGMWDQRELTLTGLGGPERILAVAVSDGTLQALGVQPSLGRWFLEAEHTSGTEGSDPVIVSYGFWQRRLGGDRAVLGREVSLDSRSYRVVGVMPARFRFLNLTPQPEVITPIRIDGSEIAIWGNSTASIALGYLNYSGLGKLRDDVTLEEANADLTRMLPLWLDGWPASASFRENAATWRVTPSLRPLKDEVVAGVAPMLWLLMSAVSVVLLIACANITNLLLVRADERWQEFAIRSALGAGRRRIAGELLRESVMLGVAGGTVGLVLALGGLRLLAVLAPENLPRAEEIAVGPAVLAFAAVAALVSSLLFGLIPAVKHTFDRGASLAGARGASASRERNRTRSALIVVQVALAVVLLVGAGLMVRSFLALAAVEPGFSDAENVQVARIFIPFEVEQEPERYNRAFRDILEGISARPGVTAAGFSASVPLQARGAIQGPLLVEGRASEGAGQAPMFRYWFASPGYVQALGTRLIAGRGFTWADVDDSRPVVLVSQSTARALWAEPAAAIGKRIRSPFDPADRWSEVVGVIQDVHLDGLYQPAPPTVYWPWRMGSDLRAVTYAIRSTRAGTEGFVNEVRQAVWATYDSVPVFEVSTMGEIYSDSFAQMSFMLVLLATAALLALLLSIVGIYGAVSYIVSRRSREVGIRLALGAKTSTVKRMFLLQGLATATIGIAVGLAAAAAFSRSLASLLFGVQPLDAATYLAVLAVLLAAVMLAAYLPARRAATLDPARILRTD